MVDGGVNSDDNPDRGGLGKFQGSLGVQWWRDIRLGGTERAGEGEAERRHSLLKWGKKGVELFSRVLGID